VAGGDGFQPRVLFYVGVPDVEAALRKAESLGARAGWGRSRSGPPKGTWWSRIFTDPEGNMIGLAGTA